MRPLGHAPLCLLALAACDAGVAVVEVARDRPQVLEPGHVHAGALELARSQRADFAVDVPADAIALRIELVAREAELSLALRKGEAVGDDGEHDLQQATEDGRASVRLDRFGEPAVARGRWHVRVLWDSESPPRGTQGDVRRVPFSLSAEVFRATADSALVAGKPLEAQIAPRAAGSRTFRIDLEAGTRALRFDLLDTDSDLDLYAHAGGPFVELDASVLAARHLYGRESLVLRGKGDAPLAAGPWFVDVVAPLDEDRPLGFALLATLAAEPPANLLALPALPLRSDGAVPELARALASVVELTVDDGAGSGVLVGADGWILTNAHVVERLGGGASDDVVIGFPLDVRRPAVELFRGKVERFDHERDIALVRVTSGFYGQPLPQGYLFPTLELSAGTPLAIGSPLWLVGYPSTGGEGSRVTISATRGVIAGFERGPLGTLIKTDAEITQGNSGGAALDGQGRLIGVPSSTVENGSGQIGYVRPLELVPDDWRALLRAGAPR